MSIVTVDVKCPTCGQMATSVDVTAEPVEPVPLAPGIEAIPSANAHKVLQPCGHTIRRIGWDCDRGWWAR